MKSLRSIAFVALALFAGAFIAAPAAATVAAEYPVYDTIARELKSTPATVANMAADIAVHRCKVPVVQASTSLGRSIQSARGARVLLSHEASLPSIEFFRRC
ncbi:hypothetical protein PVA19_15350 [Agrobacterium sp. CNPSo 3708]|uniref:hypothetical protein n=1 Tax=Agrobacterium sp. CNPSo 3708 TaxID=3028150 RepID=UPI002363D613|nr:hypothetical protein [Agrobacterium sp. CNPSo 3708]MDD1499797.1 hypothetical protein [Agrobacterium sp. CNPSo 3708]